MTPDPATSRLPYPGLRSFRREESDLFFGREDCINTMVDRLAATRFLGVLGSSGTGKSSVVKTGLLDALDLGLMAPAGSTWRVIDMRPGGAPLTNLAQKLLESAHPEGANPVGEADVALLRAFLLRGPRSIVEWCADGHLPEHTNLLLLVDQFEELFRYQDYAGREEAEAFAALLIESARQTRFPIYVALTMRSEYLGACALIDGLAEAISAGMFLIPRMTREQCRAAIVGPATVCGFKIEDALANRVLNDLAAFAPWDDRSSRDQLDRLGRRADQLPLLQYCLNRMWSSASAGVAGGPITLTIADYERIGGLSGALDAHANEILSSLGAERRPIAERVFRALTDGATVTEAVRRPTRFGELAEICDGDEAGVRAVVDAFRASGCNFLAPELDPNHPKPLETGTIVDISHESLIRQWKQLSEWLEKEARAARQWRRLLDRLEDKQPMQGAELSNMQGWRDEDRPNAAWARRYGGDFRGATAFIDWSQLQQRRNAPIVLPFVCLTSFIVVALIVLGAFNLAFDSSDLPWYVLHGVWALTIAFTCSFAFWQYAEFALRRSIFAGLTIVVVSFGLDVIFMILLTSRGFNLEDASFRWNVTLAAPTLVTTLAVFEPTPRRLSIWLMMVLTWIFEVIIIAVVARLLGPNSSGSVFLMTLLAVCIWFAVYGLRLRRSHVPSDGGGYSWWRAACSLAGLFSLLAIVAAATEVAFFPKLDEPPWRWLIDAGVYGSGVPAITLAFGLWSYCGFEPRRAVTSGITIFAIVLIPNIAWQAFLMETGVSQIEASFWAGLLFYTPAILEQIHGNWRYPALAK